MSSLRRAVSVVLAASLLAGCGKQAVRTSIERRNVETVRAVPEAKAVSVRPRVTAAWDDSRGVLVLSAAKELTGELHEVEVWDEATVSVNGTGPDPVPYMVSSVMTVGLPWIFALFDDRFRREAQEAFMGKELERKESVVAKVGDKGSPLGITGTSRAPWAKARAQVIVEDRQVADIELDGHGKGVAKLPELITQAEPLLANEGLAVRTKVALNGLEAEELTYLGPAELAVLRGRVAGHALATGRALLKQGDAGGAVRNLTLAAELGKPEAQVALAALLREGRGVLQNHQEAVKWLTRAAQQGFGEGQLQLADLLADRRDDSQAYYWALLAAAQPQDDLARRAIWRREDTAKRLKTHDIERAQLQAAAFRPVAEEKPVAVAAQAAAEGVPPLDTRRIKGKANAKAVALVIGIEDYEKLPPAQFAGRDARAFRDFALAAMGIPREQLRILLNQEARLLDVQKAVDTWLKAEIAGGARQVYVYFSGHGLASEDGRSVYLLPHDGDRALLARSGIDRAALVDQLVKAGAESVTLFLDTCYSGGTRGNETLLADMRPVVIVPRDDGVPEPVAILAAASGSQLSSAYAPARHGLFSYFLLRGLMGEADADGDRTLTLRELHRFTEEKVRRVAITQGRQQTPVLLGGGDAVVARW